MTKRSVLILAVFTTLGAAFRHSPAHMLKLVEDSSREEPPDVEGLMTQAASVIDAKIAAADQRLQEAQQSLMSLSTAQAGQNTSNKGMSAHEAVDAMMAANKEKAAAMAVKEKIKLMVDSCTTLFGAVHSFQTNAEPRATLQREEAAADMESKLDDLKQATVDAEKLDLANLLKLIAEIRAAQEKVVTLDAQVSAGAAEGMVGATKLVYTYAEQLEQRSNMLTSASAFAEMPDLEPKDAKLKIDDHQAKSIQKAEDHINGIIEAKTKLVAAANQNLITLSTSTNPENATKMHTVIDEMMAANQAKAAAEALRAAIDETIQAITNFFSMFGGYRSKQASDRDLALKDADAIAADASAIRANVDKSVLLEVGTFFHLYQVMWLRAQEAQAAMPDDDEDFTAISSGVDEKGVAVHEWLNGEVMSVCTYWKTCKEARKNILGEMEKKANWCDERFTKIYCVEENEGHQPNGKICRWNEPNPDAGMRGFCKQVNPPTRELKFGQNDEANGSGIFY